ncbi:single-stranded DNA-binding protein [Cysteiniphilum halobium]|uniref:single-stranded DNA-binding protein n=1 Tax=Cysteiniphilum halobium TaxID=2219059 RepID=UPI003F869D14
MSKGTVNKVILIGRLGNEPDVRYMTNGNAVSNISLATNSGYKDNQTGQYIDVTEWHRVVVFGKQAETIQQYTHKGSQLFVEGRIRTNKWQDQMGQDRYTTEIVANQIQLMGSQSNNHNPPVESYAQNDMAIPSNQPVQQKPEESNQTNQTTVTTTSKDDAKQKDNQSSHGNAQSKSPSSDQKAITHDALDPDELPF